MNYEKMTVKDLKALAKELSVLPPGRPKKADIILALQPGGPPVEAPAEQSTVSQQIYQFNHTYTVTEPFSGYEKGDKVSNFPRAKGLMLVKEGKIKLDKSFPPASNPNAIARKTPQSA